MSDQVIRTTIDGDDNKSLQPELIMGKYKSQDDLIHAFKELKNSYDNLSQNKNSFTVPSEYNTPENFSLIDNDVINSAKEKAQKRGYTQSQYETLLTSSVDRENKAKESKSSRDKKYGEKLGLLSSFINEELGLESSIINKFDDDSIDKLLQYREKSISTNTDLSSNGYSSKLSSDDLHTMYSKAEKARSVGDMVGFEFYLNQYKEASQKLRGQ
jgi:hypothetical protein